MRGATNYHMPARPGDQNSLLPGRDAARARGWLDRYGVALTRNDKAGLDTARRALKELGISINRIPPVAQGGKA